MTENILEVIGLAKTFGRLKALDNVTFNIRRREILGLLGPNGSGKTTLFECLAGIQTADSGEINGGKASENIFYLPDAIVPWPDQPVWWVLQFALGFFGGSADIHSVLVDKLDLRSILHVRMRALSKGQRKRALLAVGLLTPQPLLLIDEPFDGLDLRQIREAVETLRWCSGNGRTLFLSVHQIADAARICHRFVLLNAGHVCAEGSAEELTDLAARRTGKANLSDFEEVFLALT